MLGATMVLIYMRDKTMTKRTCDVGSHGRMFQVVPEYWRTKQVYKRKPVLLNTTDEKREKRHKGGDYNIYRSMSTLNL